MLNKKRKLGLVMTVIMLTNFAAASLGRALDFAYQVDNRPR